ncbi:MAG TPA: 2-methylaconitate cis-trans isomerase PrpF [Steroidobacteraceae bacterium]
MTQLRIPAVYMRGGTSKGVFFLDTDLPSDPVARDRILVRVIGSPDPYGKHIDGMGGATSSTSKVVVISKSTRPDSDVDYLYGAISIDKAIIDWSGNCGNLSTAVGPFAISAGLVSAPASGMARVRIWQANIGKRIVAHVPMRDGAVQEEGDFALDGVAFPAAEVQLEFLDPGAEADQAGTGGLFPTGKLVQQLEVPGVGAVEATLIDSGIPMIFIEAKALGLKGSELQADVNGDADLIARAESIRAHGALAMGLARSAEEATATRPHSPKIAFVAAPATYAASDGRIVNAEEVHLLARTFSMGPLHHAMTGTGSVAIATAAAIPGTVVHRVARPTSDGKIRFGHPSGTLTVGAQVRRENGRWVVARVFVSRSARRLMEGWVRVPAE